MTEILLVVLIVLMSFLLSFYFTKWWIRLATMNGLVGKDMNKFKKPLVAEAGGIAVITAIVFSILFYIALKVFVLTSESNMIGILALLMTLILAGFIGFIDDILGWKKGLKQWQKLLMTLPAAFPLMVISAGQHSMNIPFIGEVGFGLIYPLILIPIAIMGTSNGYNILAGYNGLEAGLGIVIFSFLGIVAASNNAVWLSVIALIIVASLIAFLLFNRYPSKVFPGDSLTYPLGVLVGCFAILGNMEKIALFLFIPFIIEGVLKLRSKLEAENFGIPKKDDSLSAPYNKTYSLTHFAINTLKTLKPSKKVYEKEVVGFLIGFELLIAIILLVVYII